MPFPRHMRNINGFFTIAVEWQRTELNMFRKKSASFHHRPLAPSTPVHGWVDKPILRKWIRCSKRESLDVLLPLLHNMVTLNDGNCRLAMPIVKGRGALVSLPKIYVVCVQIRQINNHDKTCLQWICEFFKVMLLIITSMGHRILLKWGQWLTWNVLDSKVLGGHHGAHPCPFGPRWPHVGPISLPKWRNASTFVKHVITWQPACVA